MDSINNKNILLGKKTNRSNNNTSKTESEVAPEHVLDVDLLHSEVDPPSDTDINPQNDAIPATSKNCIFNFRHIKTKSEKYQQY